jgi:hypothetical protein
MLARPILLTVLAGIGTLALPFIAFIVGLGVMGPGGAEQGRGIAIFALVVCGAFALWEVLELRLALRSSDQRRGTHIGLAVTSLVLTTITLAGYVLLRVALR